MQAKRSLGQNFLVRPEIARAVAEAGSVVALDKILEIGPGKGLLTSELLRMGAIVIAVEKDRSLLPALQEKFKKEIEEKKLFLVDDDILAFSPEKAGLQPGKYKLIANIPYYITGQIFRKFLQEKNSPGTMVLMVQKEVAERIIAQNGKESILSLSVKVYGVPKYIKTIKAGSFSPAPKVDSAILLVENISKKNFLKEKDAEEKFFEILKTGFSQKRKLLKKNLAPLFDAGSLQQSFLSCELEEKARAEDVPLEKWLCLANYQG